jgi:hypothetical protein
MTGDDGAFDASLYILCADKVVYEFEGRLKILIAINSLVLHY